MPLNKENETGTKNTTILILERRSKRNGYIKI